MRFSWKPNEKQKKLLGGVAVVLLLAAAFRGITERAFLAQASIEGTFAMLNPENSQGTVTLTGRYLPPPYGFSEEKLLTYFAESIGLEVDGPIREVMYEGRKEYVFEKTAAEAWSLVKVVYLPETEAYYVCAEVTLTGGNTAGTPLFRERMQAEAERMGFSEITTTMELSGLFAGEIPLAEKDRLTDELLSGLYAQPVYEHRENKNYTVYAYTGAVEDYIVVEKKKINVQIAIYYDRDTDCSEVVLATPIGLR